MKNAWTAMKIECEIEHCLLLIITFVCASVVTNWSWERWTETRKADNQGQLSRVGWDF